MNDFETMGGLIATFSGCGLTLREMREEIAKLLNHPLASEIDNESDWLDLPLQIYLAKLNHGDLGMPMGMEMPVPIGEEQAEPNKEAMFLKALTDIEKAIS